MWECVTAIKICHSPKGVVECIRNVCQFRENCKTHGEV